MVLLSLVISMIKVSPKYADIRYELILCYDSSVINFEKNIYRKTKSKTMEKIGAPKKTIKLLPSHWHESLLELYRRGGSDKEAKALIYSWIGKFSNNLWGRWMKEEEDFWETIKRGRILSEAWWEHEGRTNLLTKNFNVTLWYMNMRNRFGWANKRKIDKGIDRENIQIHLVRRNDN